MKYIQMNAEETKAVLDGLKVQLRIVVPEHLTIISCDKEKGFISFRFDRLKTPNSCGIDEFIADFAKYKIGETIWVREHVGVTHFLQSGSSSEGDYQEKVWFKYLADDTEDYIDVPERFGNTPKWIKQCQGKPIGCIKEMARIFLKITDVRVERLQDIILDDIEKEGFDSKNYMYNTALDLGLDWWETLWNKTAQKGYKYLDNPYVFVYEFKRVL